jgi:hypothetical protein
MPLYVIYYMYFVQYLDNYYKMLDEKKKHGIIYLYIYIWELLLVKTYFYDSMYFPNSKKIENIK